MLHGIFQCLASGKLKKIDFHFTDCRYLCFQFKRKNIADHSQWIMLIPDFVAFFFMSLSLFSVESLQHLILRSLNSWNFYLIIQQYTEVKFEKKKCFTDINSKYYLCLSLVSWIRWKIYVTGKNLHYPVPSDYSIVYFVRNIVPFAKIHYKQIWDQCFFFFLPTADDK